MEDIDLKELKQHEKSHENYIKQIKVLEIQAGSAGSLYIK